MRWGVGSRALQVLRVLRVLRVMRVMLLPAVVVLLPAVALAHPGEVLLDPRAGLPIEEIVERTPGEVLASFGALGVRHILGGWDHLLFVTGLLFLVRGPRALLLTITAFTLGHSLTLGWAALGGAAPAAGPIEAWIAGSLVLLGRELLRAEGTWSGRHPETLAALFGLVHGFGFAGALTRAGIPDGAAVPALAGFNLGVEVGQIAFVAMAGLVWLGLRRVVRREQVQTAAAWLLGVGGSAAFVGRVLTLG